MSQEVPAYQIPHTEELPFCVNSGAQEALTQHFRGACGTRQPQVGEDPGLIFYLFPAPLLQVGVTGQPRASSGPSEETAPSWFAALPIALGKLQANSCDFSPQVRRRSPQGTQTSPRAGTHPRVDRHPQGRQTPFRTDRHPSGQTQPPRADRHPQGRQTSPGQGPAVCPDTSKMQIHSSTHWHHDSV